MTDRKITVTSNRDPTDRNIRDPTLEQGIDHAPQSTADQNAAPQSDRLKIEVYWDEDPQTFIAICWLEPGCLCAGYGATVRAAVNDLLDEMRAEP